MFISRYLLLSVLYFMPTFHITAERSELQCWCLFNNIKYYTEFPVTQFFHTVLSTLSTKSWYYRKEHINCILRQMHFHTHLCLKSQTVTSVISDVGDQRTVMPRVIDLGKKDASFLKIPSYYAVQSGRVDTKSIASFSDPHWRNTFRDTYLTNLFLHMARLHFMLWALLCWIQQN